MRGKSLICTLMVLTLVTTLAMVSISYGADPPNVYVDPATAVSNPTEYVDVNINVTNSPDIIGFSFNLRWNRKILGFPPGPPYAGDNSLCNVTEGDFLSSAGSTYFTVVPYFVEMYVKVGCHITVPATTASGNGTLATFRFYVQDSGVTNLTLFEVELYDALMRKVPVTSQNGYFHTTKPFVDFTWTPVSPEVGEVATFNASACWDPDGGSIMNYTWDWGDGNSNVTTSLVINHTYSSYNANGWDVTLTAADDENETWSRTHNVGMWHELVAVNIWPAIALLQYDWWFMDTVDRKIIRGEYLWILGTVVNLGTYGETFNVTLTARHIATNTTVDLECAWGGGSVVEEALGTGTAGGSGWDLMFEWYTDDALPGAWELTLAATPVPGEVPTANNVLKLSMEILPYGELSESLNELVSRTMGLSGKITIQDVVIAALAFGCRPGDANWNPLVDFNGDGLINILDLVVIGIAFGTAWDC